MRFVGESAPSSGEIRAFPDDKKRRRGLGAIQLVATPQLSQTPAILASVEENDLLLGTGYFMHCQQS